MKNNIDLEQLKNISFVELIELHKYYSASGELQTKNYDKIKEVEKLINEKLDQFKI